MKRTLIIVASILFSICAFAQNADVSDSLKLEMLRAKLDARRSDTDENARKHQQNLVEKARIKAEKRREFKNRKDKYEKQYGLGGLTVDFDLAYGYQIASGTVAYHHSGYRDYGDLVPFQARLSAGWRFGFRASASVGIGLVCNAKTINVGNDSFSTSFDGFKYRPWDLPVFANGRYYFTLTRFQPYVSLTGGCYVMSKTLLAEGMAGVQMHVSKHFSANLEAGLGSTPWPFFTEYPLKCGYKGAVTPTVRIGLNF